MIEKTTWMNQLLDMYFELLTEKQKEILQMYYQEDLSLREIGEECGISHAGVSDHLKRASQMLENYESCLHCVEKQEKRREIYDKMSKLKNKDIDKLIQELKETES